MSEGKDITYKQNKEKRMKKNFLFCCCAGLLFAGMVSAQTPAADWQAGVDQLKELIKNDPEQAEDFAKDLTKGKNKKNLDLMVAVGEAYLEAKNFDEAEKYADKAGKVDRKDPQVFILRGDIALAREDVGTACGYYEQAILFDPQCYEAYLKYARAYKAASPSQAIDKLKQLKQIAPDYKEADKALADVYYSNNRFGEAAEAYAAFINTPVATERDLSNYAFALFLNHDFEKSLDIALKGIEKNPKSAVFNRLAMYNYADLKRFPEAEQRAEVFFNELKDVTYSSLDYRYHGVLLTAQSRYDDAVASYKKAIELDSAATAIWKDVSEVYETAGKYQESIDAYQKYCEFLPSEEKTLENDFQVGRLYYGWGTSTDTVAVTPDIRMAALQKADSVFASVAGQAPDSYLGNMWRARTNSLMDPETTQGLAKPYYEKVVEMLLPKNDARYNTVLTECYSYLGYYFLLQSDYATSTDYWNKILAIDPNNAVAKRALDGIAAMKKQAAAAAAAAQQK